MLLLTDPGPEIRRSAERRATSSLSDLFNPRPSRSVLYYRAGAILSLLIAVKFSERIRCGYEHKRALEKRPRVVTGKGQQEILGPS